LLMHHNCAALRDIVVLDVIACLVTPASIVMCQHDIHMLQCHEKARSAQNEACDLPPPSHPTPPLRKCVTL